MSFKFRALAEDELRVMRESGERIEERPCKDQFVGIVSEILETMAFERTPIRRREYDCLIIILESPHIDEYLGEGDPQPANGTTGENIRNTEYWNDVFGERFNNYGLILMNAIQYQCSLRDIPRFRDRIFKRVWVNGGRTDLLRRLKRYVGEGDVIVNCCTKGNPNAKEHLRDLVQDAIKGCEWKGQSTPEVLKRTHPSSWGRSKGNRKNQDWPYTKSTKS